MTDWLVCALPEDSMLGLAVLGSPFYDTRTDPFTAYRVDTYHSDLNECRMSALYPVTLTRLNRVHNVVVPLSDLYPVFSESSLSELEDMNF